MDGLWLGLAFLVWLGSGLSVWKALGSIRDKLSQWPRKLRSTLGIALMLASGGLLIGGMLSLPFEPKSLAELGAPTLAAIFFGGSVFVVLQTFTAAVLLSLVHDGVTFRPDESSNKQISEGNEI